MTVQHYVVMGVCGCGKSTVAHQLAAALGRPFAEADAFHPPDNIRKMKQAVPLTDEDRWPWLNSLREWMDAQAARGIGGIVACSALKRSYRDVLRQAAGEVRFICLSGTRDLLVERMQNRTGHFMPLSLLDSQLATLEPPQADERADIFDIATTPQQLLHDIVQVIEHIEKDRYSSPHCKPK